MSKTKTTTRFVALLDGKPGAYGVVFPDLPGCYAMGKTVDEAIRSAIEVAGEWAQIVRETNAGKLPRARSAEALRHDPETIDALVGGSAMIIVPLIWESGRPAKANLSLDAGLLEAIDDNAKARGLTRSAFIASAVREKIVEDA